MATLLEYLKLHAQIDLHYLMSASERKMIEPAEKLYILNPAAQPHILRIQEVVKEQNKEDKNKTSEFMPTTK